MTPSDDVVCIGGMELEKGLEWGPEVAGSNLPLRRLGGKLTCLLPGPGVGSPAGAGGAGGPGGGDLPGGGGEGGGDCDAPPVAGEDTGMADAVVDRL